MSRYGFLRTRRWVGIAALTVVVSVVCTLLGVWQLSRHEFRAAAIARVQMNSTAPPVPLADLLPTPATAVGNATEWRTVEVTGEYVGAPVALPQRGIETGAADHALGVLAVDAPDGATWLIVVDRGWYPTDAFTDPTGRLALPTGTIEATLRLRPAEPASDRDPVPGQVFRVDPQQVLDAAALDDVDGELVTGGYGWLVSESPTTATAPTPLPIPSPDYRSNLSYAMQWWCFGLMAFVGYGVLARRERRMLDDDLSVVDPGEGATPRAPDERRTARPPAQRRRLTDAEIEDAEIDAAEDGSTRGVGTRAR